MREYVGKNNKESLLEKLANKLANEFIKIGAENHKSKNILFLIDGLDEFPDLTKDFG